ncbi:MAG: 4Fe-4S dicluster domain-containing protein [Polyangiaceae bacterium]|jgi:NADH-quinone oxidoreductase subunit I
MSYLVDAAKALRTTLKNVFRRPTTVEFPSVIRPRAERYRASFALPDDEHGEIACIGCLACERICPSQVIKMKSGGKRESPVTGKKRAYVEEFVLDLSACIQCELCVQVCNSDAIFMTREPEVPGFSREDLVLDIVRLRANAREKTPAWGRGTTLQEAQEPPKVEKAPAKPAAPTQENKPVIAPPENKPAPALLETKPAAAPLEKESA